MSTSAICSMNILAVLILLAVIIYSSHNLRLKEHKLPLIVMSVAIIVFLACDSIYAVFLEHSDSASLNVLFISKSIYFILNSFLVCYWAQFVRTEIGHIKYKNFIHKNMFFLLFGLNTLLILINPFAKIVFSISSQGTFEANMIGMWIFTIINYLVLICVLGMLFSERNNIRPDILIPLFLFPAPPFVAEIIRLVDSDYDLISFYSISALLILFMLQNSLLFRDDLSEIGNRSHMQMILNRWFNAPGEMTICGIMLDIDGLKKINESISHLAGDQTIIRTANILTQVSGSNMEPIRYEGDSFILLWHTQGENNIEDVQNKITALRNEINKSLPYEEQLRFTTSSYSCSNKSNITQEDFLKIIDFQLYQQKTEMDSIIEEALTNHQFKLQYQLIWNLKEKRFSAAEALCRLYSPSHGFIPPVEFIEAAEKSGAIHELGDEILNMVCDFINSDKFKELGLDYVEVNLSVMQCMGKNLANRICKIVDKKNVSRDKINFEITETAITLSQVNFWENINAILKAGFKISLDDFGSGYSNCQRLTSIPFAIVKMDKFLVDQYSDERGAIVISNLTKMIHELGTSVLMEGVETDDQVKFVEQLDCEFIQGFYYSKPSFPEDL